MEVKQSDGIELVKDILPTGLPFVPALSDYVQPSDGWSEAEYRHFDAPSTHTVVGYWTGEPGRVSFDAWPYTEVCSILAGKVGVEDQYGRRRDFTAGQGFIVPKGFKGSWITYEASKKIFIAID